jgi:hypothetical protein
MKKPRPGITKARRKKKQVPAPVPQIETEIIDVVEEPFPSVLTITEFESERLVTKSTKARERFAGSLSWLAQCPTLFRMEHDARFDQDDGAWTHRCSGRSAHWRPPQVRRLAPQP